MAFADSMLPVVDELHRRHEASELTAVRRVELFKRMRGALGRFLDHVDCETDAPTVILAPVPGDRVLIALGATEARWSPRP